MTTSPAHLPELPEGWTRVFLVTATEPNCFQDDGYEETFRRSLSTHATHPQVVSVRGQVLTMGSENDSILGSRPLIAGYVIDVQFKPSN